MLEYIDSIEKILDLNIPTIVYILQEDKSPDRDSDDLEEYFQDLEEGEHLIAYLILLIEERLEVPNRLVRDPPRPVQIPLPLAIYREHRKLRQCLKLFNTELDERHEIVQDFVQNGWHQGYS